ncbi:MAG TPA: PQQ-binding-like beta-propeller repeat protein [Vicinamibacterales bacterium]
MSTLEIGAVKLRKPLRLWPGVIAAVAIVLLRFAIPVIAPAMTPYGVIAGVLGGLVIALWWVFFSRAPWLERVVAIAAMLLAGLAAGLVVHHSIATGMMGFMLPVYALPITVGPAFVAWAVATRHRSGTVRLVTMVATIFAASLAWTLLRTEGVTGEGVAQLTWRWTPSAEEQLVAVPLIPAEPTPPPEEPKAPPAASPPAEAPVTAPPKGDATPKPVVARAAWTGFRGGARDAVVRGVRIATDWSAAPPAELWRRPVGPGWSSFAVAGDLFYTQEQRGENELVACYRLSTGEPVWVHRDAARFYESNGGPGPRGTPALGRGRVYTMGATGILNALDAKTGAVIWSRNAAADTGAPEPGWGFAGSPLVLDDKVIVAASGRLAAYTADRGDLLWTRKTQGGGYSSPQLVTIDGVVQIVLPSGGGITAVAPSDGSVLWENTWEPGTSIVQPAVVAGGLVFSGADMMGAVGLRRIAVVHSEAGWSVEERWTSRGLKPYFNDFVIHEGHAYGFDGSILASIDLASGERTWKGGRYGHGQMILLPEQDVLLVLSEDGELALVSATPDRFTEVAKFKAIEGKTWNHPAVAGDVLLVRNGEEMAAFRLARARR